MRYGILGAMKEEILSIKEKMVIHKIENSGSREFYIGTLNNTEIVLAFSSWGKVAAAQTTAAMIERYDIDKVIFTGVAGGVKKGLKPGDIIIGENLFQYDMDITPLGGKRFEVPIIGKTFFSSDEELVKLSKDAANEFINNKLFSYVDEKIFKELKIEKPNIYFGNIASGDQFIADVKKVDWLMKNIVNLYCVEMEGAAVAQVCYQYNKPFCVVRVISDNANEEASIDFRLFIKNVASQFTMGIVNCLLK